MHKMMNEFFEIKENKKEFEVKLKEIFDRVGDDDKVAKIVHYALLTISKSDGTMSPLLALQIAEEDWDY